MWLTIYAMMVAMAVDIPFAIVEIYTSGGEYGGVGAGCGDGNPLGRSDPYGSLQSAVEPGAGKIAGGHMFAFLCYHADNYRAAGSSAAGRKYDCAVCSRKRCGNRRGHRCHTGREEE